VYAKGVPTLTELYEGEQEPPPTTGPKAKKNVSVIFMTCGLESPGCADPAYGMEEAAKALGWNYKIINGKLNVNNGYFTGFREAIAAKPDAIAMEGIGCSELTQPLREAKSAGIPVLAIEGIDCNNPKVGGTEELLTIPFYFNKAHKETPEWYEQFGRNQADYLIDATEGKAKAITTEFQGTFGLYDGEAVKKEFAKCSECEILENIPFQSSEQEPNGPLFQSFSTALTKYPQANAVLMTFDTDVVTADLSKAVVDSGRVNEIQVVGGEGTAAGMTLLEEGERGLNAEGGSHDKHWIGWAGADTINRFLQGQPSVPEGPGFVVVTAEHNLPPKGQPFLSSIPYKEDYEKLWGV
jgi:ribose transport system substrate-binding protein